MAAINGRRIITAEQRAAQIVQASKIIANTRDVVIVGTPFFQKIVGLVAQYDTIAVAMVNFLHLSEVDHSDIDPEELEAMKASMGAKYRTAVQMMRQTVLGSLGPQMYCEVVYTLEKPRVKQDSGPPTTEDPEVDPS